MSRFLSIVLLGLFTLSASAQDDKVAALKAENEKLRTELAEANAAIAAIRATVDQLKAENAALKEKLGEKPAEKPKEIPDFIESPAAELKGEATIGAYKHKVPTGWTAQPLKDSKLGMMYRSADKSGVILVQVKPKGAAPPEMAGKYADSVIQMLRQDFTKSKTELVSPPKVVGDNRFFVKVQEQFKVKDKTAEQTHLYRVEGKDMLEMTVISTGSSDVAATTLRLAEDMLLSFAAK